MYFRRNDSLFQMIVSIIGCDLLRQFDATTTGKEYEGKKSFLDKLKNHFN